MDIPVIGYETAPPPMEQPSEGIRWVYVATPTQIDGALRWDLPLQYRWVQIEITSNGIFNLDGSPFAWYDQTQAVVRIDTAPRPRLVTLHDERDGGQKS